MVGVLPFPVQWVEVSPRHGGATGPLFFVPSFFAPAFFVPAMVGEKETDFLGLEQATRSKKMMDGDELIDGGFLRWRSAKLS